MATLKLLYKVNWIKTLYFNLKYFSLKVALRLPVLIYRRTDLYRAKGRIVLNVAPRMGLVKIGPHGIGTQDVTYSRTMWDVDGTLVINGRANIGRGSKISIGKDGVLTLGDNLIITGRSTIICQKEVCIGNDSLLSWDILIMDTDFHHIIDSENHIVNDPRPVRIGNHVWIGCRSTILKGVSIADNVVVSASSTITRNIDESHCVAGGFGKELSILKQGIDWKM